MNVVQEDCASGRLTEFLVPATGPKSKVHWLNTAAQSTSKKYKQKLILYVVYIDIQNTGPCRLVSANLVHGTITGPRRLGKTMMVLAMLRNGQLP